MNTKLSKDQINFILDYINKLESQFEIYEDSLEICNNEEYTFDVIIEIINVFKADIPELEDAVLLKTGSATRDANTIIGLLKKHLIDSGYKLKETKITIIERFWTSFMSYFKYELPYKDYLKDMYVSYNNWDGGTAYIEINYDYQFRLHYGLNYDENMFNTMANIKMFIELSFSEWIKPDKRYEYTKDINSILRKFKLPYKLSKGKIVSAGYKTTNLCDKIINYSMLERKIQFAEEMIMSSEILDKKAALDYIVDSLQYLVSIQKGKSAKDKYESSTMLICGNNNTKQYTVIKNELEEIMKISNLFFDIRHNEYLNDANEVREPLSDSLFIEYLYNRIYSILYILKLKTAKMTS